MAESKKGTFKVFYGRAGDAYITVLGNRVMIPPSKLKVKVVAWDLDKKGKPQKGDDGEIKTKVIDSCVVSVTIEYINKEEEKKYAPIR